MRNAAFFLLLLVLGCSGGGGGSEPALTSGTYVVTDGNNQITCNGVRLPSPGEVLVVLVADANIHIEDGDGDVIANALFSRGEWSESFPLTNTHDDTDGHHCETNGSGTDRGWATGDDAFRQEVEIEWTLSNPQNWSGCELSSCNSFSTYEAAK